MNPKPFPHHIRVPVGNKNVLSEPLEQTVTFVLDDISYQLFGSKVWSLSELIDPEKVIEILKSVIADRKIFQAPHRIPADPL